MSFENSTYGDHCSFKTLGEMETAISRFLYNFQSKEDGLVLRIIKDCVFRKLTDITDKSSISNSISQSTRVVVQSIDESTMVVFFRSKKALDSFNGIKPLPGTYFANKDNDASRAIKALIERITPHYEFFVDSKEKDIVCKPLTEQYSPLIVRLTTN